MGTAQQKQMEAKTTTSNKVGGGHEKGRKKQKREVQPTRNKECKHESKKDKKERIERKHKMKEKQASKQARKNKRASLLTRYWRTKRKFPFWRVTFPNYLTSLHLMYLSNIQKPV